MYDEEQWAKDWKEVVDAPFGYVFRVFYVDGLPCVIRRGFSSLCAYVGVPPDSEVAKLNRWKVPVECHGGINYGGAPPGDGFPEGFHWFGWDYGHGMDADTTAEDIQKQFGVTLPSMFARDSEDWKRWNFRWTVPLVSAEAAEVAGRFRKLLDGTDLSLREN